MKEKKWICWVLSESEIDHFCEELKIKLTEDEKEEVARLFKKGIEWSCDNWEEVLRDAVEEVSGQTNSGVGDPKCQNAHIAKRK